MSVQGLTKGSLVEGEETGKGEKFEEEKRKRNEEKLLDHPLLNASTASRLAFLKTFGDLTM